MRKYTTKAYKGHRVDPETGEILEYSECIEVIKEETEPFFLTYSRQILALYGKSVFNITTKVFYKLLEFAEYNTGKVYMNASRVKEIMEVCGISKASYYRAVKELKDAGLISGDKDTYAIAVNMFWKGDRKAREELKNAKLKISFAPVFPDNE